MQKIFKIIVSCFFILLLIISCNKKNNNDSDVTKNTNIKNAHFQIINAAYKEYDKDNNLLYEFNADKIELKNIRYKFFRFAFDRELIYQKPEFVFYDNEKPVVIVRADAAIQPLTKNVINFLGNVELISSYDRKIRAKNVTYDLIKKKVFTSDKFEIYEPDGSIFIGKGFSAKNNLSDFRADLFFRESENENKKN